MHRGSKQPASPAKGAAGPVQQPATTTPKWPAMGPHISPAHTLGGRQVGPATSATPPAVALLVAPLS